MPDGAALLLSVAEQCWRCWPQHRAAFRGVRWLNSDRDRVAVERGDRETFEILADGVLALVAEQTDGHGLAEPETPFVIRPSMNPRKVARQTDVRGELVDFAVDGDLARIRAGIGDQRQPISARGHDRSCARMNGAGRG